MDTKKHIKKSTMSAHFDQDLDVYECSPAAEAKKEYFLTTNDLLGVPYKSDSMGFGTGRPTKWYKCSALEAAALKKHGTEGLAKKRAQRAKREEKQLQKALAAVKAEEELKQKDQQNSADENTAPNPTAAKVVVVSGKTLQTIRKDIRKAFKPLMTWDHLRTRNSPNGCSAVAQVPRVQQAEYAALIGRPTDVNLSTLVKSGAWYSLQVPYSTVMDSNEATMGTGGRYGCNKDLGIDPDSHLTVKFKPSDNTLSVTAYVQHGDTFGRDY
jgi:hypothetical protein